MSRKNRNPKIQIGDKFNRLTVVEFLGKNKQNVYLWKCICDCGKIKNIITSNLTGGRTKSCGCLLSEHIKKLNNSREPRTGFMSLKDTYIRSAKKRNFIFELTDEQLHVIFKMNCTYCGIEPKQIKYGTNYTNEADKKNPYSYNGIDRVDSKKDYTLENCVPCCKKCNFMKLQMTFDEFFEHIEIIYKRFHRYYKNKKVS